MATYLTLLSVHHIQFCTRDASIVAAACIYVTLGIMDNAKSTSKH